MGKPIKIAELARELIILSGKIPDEDIKIEFIGIRPGEKIHEELLTEEEGIKATCYDRIFISQSDITNSEFVRTKVKNLIAAAYVNNNEEIRRILIEELKVLNPLKELFSENKREKSAL